MQAGPQALTLKCADGYPLAATAFRAAGAAKGAVVLAPALGVPRKFYFAFAQYLAERGYDALCFDYRGSGDSVRGPQRGRDMRMQHWGERDIEAALRFCREDLKAPRLFLVGHSAGGQLPGLAPTSEHLDGLVLVAASAPHLRHYPRKSWGFLMTTWYLLGPLLSIGRDQFPAKQTGLGSTPVAAGVVAQWSRWARTRDYMFTPANRVDTQRYAKLDLPLLSWCFADDTYATENAVDALLKHYAAARITRRVEPAERPPVGHFGFFRKERRETFWKQTADWIEVATR